jgi:hypothetical protein
MMVPLETSRLAKLHAGHVDTNLLNRLTTKRFFHSPLVNGNALVIDTETTDNLSGAYVFHKAR